VQAAENVIHSSYGDQAPMQSRVGMVEDQQGSQAGQMNQTTQGFRPVATRSNQYNGLSESNHLIVPADNVISSLPSQTSGSMTIVPRAPSPMLSCHAQCSNVGSQKPSYWQAVEGVEKKYPKIKFLGNSEMNFERFMASMESTMDAEGVTDELRVEHIDNWFSGEALKIVQSKKNNDIIIDAATTLKNIKADLMWFFGSKAFDAEGMLKDLAKGKPIARGDSKGIQTFLLNWGASSIWPGGRGWRPYLNGKVYI
jgi:hypothetical protein